MLSMIFLSFLLSRLLRLHLLLQPFEQTTIVDCPYSVLVEKPLLVFAQVVQHLPLREATQPSFEVFRFPVCLEQLLELHACQGIRPGMGMLLEDRLKLFRNEPGDL